MCQGNYFNIRIWGKSISGGTEERPIWARLAERSYILLFCLLARWSAYPYFWTSHGPKESPMHLILRSPWTRPSTFWMRSIPNLLLWIFSWSRWYRFDNFLLNNPVSVYKFLGKISGLYQFSDWSIPVCKLYGSVIKYIRIVLNGIIL